MGLKMGKTQNGNFHGDSVCINIYIYLVGGLEHCLFSIICAIILPIDELIFFKMVIAPPTRYCKIHIYILCYMYIPGFYIYIYNVILIFSRLPVGFWRGCSRQSVMDFKPWESWDFEHWRKMATF
jgi:hypothetical protein